MRDSFDQQEGAGLHECNGVNAQIPIFVINLENDRQRLDAMRMQLASLSLQWDRIPAVDGVQIPARIRFQENRRARDRKLSPGELGCLQSHVLAWRRVAEGQRDAGLILEDDVLLAADTARYVTDSAWLVSSDCIVRLEAFPIPAAVLGPRVKMVHNRGLYPLRSIQHGGAAYIITRERACALLRAYHDYVDTADHLMFRYPLANHVYQFSPAPCVQRDIYEHGRLGVSSTLQKQRQWIQWRTMFEPLPLARHLTWRLSSVIQIGRDLAQGYALQAVRYRD